MSEFSKQATISVKSDHPDTIGLATDVAQLLACELGRVGAYRSLVEVIDTASTRPTRLIAWEPGPDSDTVQPPSSRPRVGAAGEHEHGAPQQPWRAIPAPGPISYMPWTDGHCVGLRCTSDRHADYYIYLKPVASVGETHSSVFVHAGRNAKPGADHPLISVQIPCSKTGAVRVRRTPSSVEREPRLGAEVRIAAGVPLRRAHSSEPCGHVHEYNRRTGQIMVELKPDGRLAGPFHAGEYLLPAEAWEGVIVTLPEYGRVRLAALQAAARMYAAYGHRALEVNVTLGARRDIVAYWRELARLLAAPQNSGPRQPACAV